jgi:26-hydroxylase
MLVSEFIYEWARRRLDEPQELFRTLCVFVVALLVVRLVQFLGELRRLPPGPWGVPVLGYLPFLKGDVHLHFHKLVQQYGSIFSARLGNQLVVVLSDHHTIREAFKREEFTGRPHTGFSNLIEGYGESRKIFLFTCFANALAAAADSFLRKRAAAHL